MPVSGMMHCTQKALSVGTMVFFPLLPAPSFLFFLFLLRLFLSPLLPVSLPTSPFLPRLAKGFNRLLRHPPLGTLVMIASSKHELQPTWLTPGLTI